MRICETFYSVQGEIDIGKPAIFIRLQGCNMQPKCSFCDTSYSWNEGKEMNNNEIYEEILPYLRKCNYIVFTGGEPTCQLNDIVSFMDYLKEKIITMYYGIETNGLIFLEDLKRFDNISVSPKKQNINIETLKKFMKIPFVRFKFVYETTDDLWFEQVIESIDVEKKYVYIMAEGKTREEQLNKMDEVIEYCKEHNYNFTPRLHTLVWGNKRAI